MDKTIKNKLAHNLKCCGNCWYRANTEMGICFEEWCSHTGYLLPSDEICPRWKYDELTHEMRSTKTNV